VVDLLHDEDGVGRHARLELEPVLLGREREVAASARGLPHGELHLPELDEGRRGGEPFHEPPQAVDAAMGRSPSRLAT
jgi:hypothetical protein